MWKCSAGNAPLHAFAEHLAGHEKDGAEQAFLGIRTLWE